MDEPIFRHILVSTDFSVVADRALGVAFTLARLCGARVTLCHVLELAAVPNPMYPSYVRTGRIPHELEDQHRDKSRAMLEARVPDDLRDRVELALPHGPPAEQILETAKLRGVDLIVLAPHGKSGILEQLLGGVAYRVVRHARCPVLVVRGENKAWG
jgi:universal stress protein A